MILNVSPYHAKKTMLAISVLLIVACSNSLSENNREEIKANGVDTDYFLKKVSVNHAKNFSVSYHNNYKVVRTSATLGNWSAQTPEVEDVQDVMVLVQRGTPTPALSGELEGAKVITIPVKQNIATNSSGLEIWMDMLGLSEWQVAIGGTKTYDDTLWSKVKSGDLGTVGYSWAAPPNMEVLLDRKPEIFLMVLSRIGFNESLTKLRQLGIVTAPVFDWAERDYMARAEWIKYCALFFNLEKEANEWFDRIEQRVISLKSAVMDIKNKPVCLWGHYVDSGFWMAHANNAEARLLRDAGVVNPAEDFTLPFSPIGTSFTNEQWLQLGHKAEHWIISQGTASVLLPSERYLEEFVAWSQNNLYHYYKRSKPERDAYDWYNMAPIRPDWVLEDLVSLFHPELLPNHDFHFFGKLEKL